MPSTLIAGHGRALPHNQIETLASHNLNLALVRFVSIDTSHISHAHAHSVYHIIEDEFQNYCSKLMKFPWLGHWVHKTVVANYIDLPKGVGEHG